jgi:hypothetical protein
LVKRFIHWCNHSFVYLFIHLFMDSIMTYFIDAFYWHVLLTHFLLYHINVFLSYSFIQCWIRHVWLNAVPKCQKLCR